MDLKLATQLRIVPTLSVRKHTFSRQSCTLYFQYSCFMFRFYSCQCVMSEAVLFDRARSVMVGSHVIRNDVKITEHRV